MPQPYSSLEARWRYRSAEPSRDAVGRFEVGMTFHMSPATVSATRGRQTAIGRETDTF